MIDFWLPLGLIVVGLFFAVHCALASRRELESGRALGGKFGDYNRSSSPLGFWMVMAGNIGAAFMGFAFLIAGVIGMLTYLEILK